VLLASSSDGATQQPSLAQVLARAAHYVTRLHDQLSGIVAEETYTQSARSLSGLGSPVIIRRTLQSDLLLVRPADADRYIEFRDVFAVDGAPVRDREQRLTKLFLHEAPADVQQVKAIIDESARYNVGNIPRNINTPMLALHFLRPDRQRRFRFSRIKSGTPELSQSPLETGSNAVFRASTEVWVVQFEERHRPTIIRSHAGRDFPARGRFWIEPETGVVRLSELVMESASVTGTIAVSYQSEPLLGFLVPVEMRERYLASDQRIDGLATYGRFRQFQVRTGETIKPPGG
jgi:hypothetical protein